MIKHSYFTIHFIIVFCFSLVSTGIIAQESKDELQLKNQVSTNLFLPLFSSVDLSYERVVANKWAIGVGAAIYGENFQVFDSGYSDYQEYTTKYEITPYGRFYFQGTQRKSHFVELFGSLGEVEERDRNVRTINEEGYGVYSLGVKDYTVGGLGVGYGYRFLFLNNKLALEAEIGIRTNFSVDYYFLNRALVRTGIKVGYRF